MESRIVPGIKDAIYDGTSMKEPDIYDVLFDSDTCWYWISDDLAVVTAFRSGMDC